MVPGARQTCQWPDLIHLTRLLIPNLCTCVMLPCMLLMHGELQGFYVQLSQPELPFHSWHIPTYSHTVCEEFLRSVISRVKIAEIKASVSLLTIFTSLFTSHHYLNRWLKGIKWAYNLKQYFHPMPLAQQPVYWLSGIAGSSSCTSRLSMVSDFHFWDVLCNELRVSSFWILQLRPPPHPTPHAAIQFHHPLANTLHTSSSNGGKKTAQDPELLVLGQSPWSL